MTLIINLFLIFLTASVSFAVGDIRYLPYHYAYDAVKDGGTDQFVISDRVERMPLKIHTPVSDQRPAWTRVLAIRVPDAVAPIAPKPQIEPKIAELQMAAKENTEKKESIACLLSTVHFDLDSYTLKPVETSRLIQSVASLGKNDSVIVNGYTCDIGTEAYNKALSQKRADTVAALLRSKGINVKEVTANGECCQLSATDKPLNRRVEILIKK